MKLRYLVVLFGILWGSLAFSADQIISLAWDASPSNDIIGYNVYWAPSPSGEWTKSNKEIIVGLEYQHIVTQEEKFEGPMYFYVTAADFRNQSLPSNVVETPVDTKIPDRATKLQITSD